MKPWHAGNVSSTGRNESKRGCMIASRAWRETRVEDDKTACGNQEFECVIPVSQQRMGRSFPGGRGQLHAGATSAARTSMVRTSKGCAITVDLFGSPPACRSDSYKTSRRMFRIRMTGAGAEATIPENDRCLVRRFELQGDVSVELALEAGSAGGDSERKLAAQRPPAGGNDGEEHRQRRLVDRNLLEGDGIPGQAKVSARFTVRGSTYWPRVEAWASSVAVRRACQRLRRQRTRRSHVNSGLEEHDF